MCCECVVCCGCVRVAYAPANTTHIHTRRVNMVKVWLCCCCFEGYVDSFISAYVQCLCLMVRVFPFIIASVAL